jgi:hypothetical protein
MRGFDIKTIGPAAALLAIMVIPLAIWSASSGSGPDGNPDLTVEWDPAKPGDPLLTVTIAERLNNRKTAKNGRDVKLECLDGDGKVVAATTQPLPFPDDEQGYGAHAHQLVPADQIDSVEKCRLRGARVPLEAPLQR